MKCKTCKHWKKEQAELGYSKFDGICTAKNWEYKFDNNSSAKVLDRQNRSQAHTGTHVFEFQHDMAPLIAVPEKSRYCLVTQDEFGCIHHQENSKKNFEKK